MHRSFLIAQQLTNLQTLTKATHLFSPTEWVGYHFKNVDEE